MSRRSTLVYGLLLAAWIAIVGWQAVEHTHVEQTARTALENRGRDITQTLTVVLRAQRRFGGAIYKERLVAALKDLIKPDEVTSIVLLNAEGEEMASAGLPVDVHAAGIIRAGVHWDEEHVTLANLVDLGTNIFTGDPLVGLVLTNQPPPPRPPSGQSNLAERVVSPEALSATTSNSVARSSNTSSNRSRFRSFSPPPDKATIQKLGLHSFVIVMSTQGVVAVANKDLWLRSVVCIFALGAAMGLGLAWQNLLKSSELEIRLVRASEQNNRLKELNLTAAGLAHETRNPLNIIRGLAQMISKESGVSEETRRRSRDIAEEADRVTAQLSEFINYSRPREVRRAPVMLGGVVNDVARALAHDVEEKKIHLQVFDTPVTIEADEQLLRQAMFNLLINSVQALPPGGDINVAVQRNNGSVELEVRDNGPGVPPDQRKEIFKPYFTTHQKGTGLGLAVVQQIVSAHEWEIECLGNEPRGAVFRISRMKVVAKPG